MLNLYLVTDPNPPYGSFSKLVLAAESMDDAELMARTGDDPGDDRPLTLLRIGQTDMYKLPAIICVDNEYGGA